MSHEHPFEQMLNVKFSVDVIEFCGPALDHGASWQKRAISQSSTHVSSAATDMKLQQSKQLQCRLDRAHPFATSYKSALIP